FDLADHVTEHPVAPLPGGGLLALAEEFFSVQLPRDRPLWELRIVPRLDGRRAAVLGKVHHAMVDGVAAVQLGLLLFDGEAQAEAGLPVPWAPRTPASVLRGALDSARDTALEQFRGARRAAELARLAPAHGHPPDDVRAMVPANVRPAEAEAQGNAISFLFVDLPVRAGPAERLRLVSERMRGLKDDGRIAGSEHVLKAVGLLP